MKTITFELESPLLYSSPEQKREIEGNHIDLNEPTGKISHLCNAIESAIQKGQMEMSKFFQSDDISKAIEDRKSKKEEDAGKEKEPEIVDSETAASMIKNVGIEDSKKLTLMFRDVFKEAALIGGEKNMTMPLLDKMSHKDFQRMMAVYTSNFMLS